MAGKSGPEARLVAKMRAAGSQKYGDRLVIIKQHGGPYAQAGVSDLLCCLDGVFVAIEVKVGGKYGLTLKQAAFLETVSRAGGEAAVCKSVDEYLSVLDEVYLHHTRE